MIQHLQKKPSYNLVNCPKPSISSLVNGCKDLNETSIQWTPDVKFVSATTTKFLVKYEFWTTKSTKFSGKFFFSKKNLGKKCWKKIFSGKNLKKFLEKIFWNHSFKLQVTIHSAHPVQISSLCHNVVSHKKSQKND